ncbi:MAG: type II toxin-antitoxin system death-on-curing family toxin [Opitutales bacterium]
MNPEPFWLSAVHILPIHSMLIARFGGSDGVRDNRAMEAALGRPKNLFHSEDPDIYSLAASYAFGLVVNLPFIDGNKRIGSMAAYTFLGMNGHTLTASEEEAVIYTLGLAAREVEESAYADWLRQNCDG